jgi:DNA-binding response OmpR family regulator
MFLTEHHHAISTAPIRVAAPRKALTAIVDMIRPLSALNELPLGTRGTKMEPARILVIDDNSRHYGQVISSLISSGYVAQIAESGDAAMLLLRQEAFDLVLLEVSTPTLDGFKVLQTLKADAQTSQLPVIMMSSQNDLDAAIRCIRLGAEDYLCTPLQGSLLKTRINASLERKAAYERNRAQLENATMLHKVGQTLNATLNPQRIMQITLKHAVQRLKPSAGLIGTVNNGTLTVADSFGFGELFETQRQLPLSEMGWQSVMQAERPYLTQKQVVIKDASGLSPFASCYIVPIKRYQRPMAAMILYHIRDNSDESMSFVEELAEDAALALWNATLYSSAIGCAEEYHTQINSVSREMKLASTTIKEYTSLLRLEAGSVSRDMKSRVLESIRNNANHLFLLSTELDAKKLTDNETPTQPTLDDAASSDDKPAFTL